MDDVETKEPLNQSCEDGILDSSGGDSAHNGTGEIALDNVSIGSDVWNASSDSEHEEGKPETAIIAPDTVLNGCDLDIEDEIKAHRVEPTCAVVETNAGEQVMESDVIDEPAVIHDLTATEETSEAAEPTERIEDSAMVAVEETSEAGAELAEITNEAKTDDVVVETPQEIGDVSSEAQKDSSVKTKDGDSCGSPIKNGEHPAENEQEENAQFESEEMDYDFDPSLLCPEMSMDVDDNSVITPIVTQPSMGNGSTSPLPFEPPILTTFIDEVTGAEVTFDLTEEEKGLKKVVFTPSNPIQLGKIHCTACNTHLGSALRDQSNRFVHPLLKVLICKKCYNFYTSGEFEKDEDGSELYCRWCGQGGQVMCCSKCEFVFCKRCVRTNLGKKKMEQIRDSDDWQCFRCNRDQLKESRMHCHEFFEYITRAMSQTSAISNPVLWGTDFTTCCMPAKKKNPSEILSGLLDAPKQRRKRASNATLDPDFAPVAKRNGCLTTAATVTKTNTVYSKIRYNPFTKNAQGNQTIDVTGSMMGGQFRPGVQLIPKSKVVGAGNGDVKFVRSIPSPQVVLNPVRGAGGGQGGTGNTPLFRHILPSGIQMKSNADSSNRPFPSPAAVFVSGVPTTSTPIRRYGFAPVPRPSTTTTTTTTTSTVPPPKKFVSQPRNVAAGFAASPDSKHAWFEKTVRGTAQINSHLSLTLARLNKSQADAGCVEQLAVVHNKLQEVLSNSINSLIQIRKNLRSEFINDIKTSNLPTKSAMVNVNNRFILNNNNNNNNNNNSINQKKDGNDDDVIFVQSPTTDPPPLIYKALTGGSPKRTILKVRSVAELQKVSTECIVIPDDSPSKSSIEKRIEIVLPKGVSLKKSPRVVEMTSVSPCEEKTEAKITVGLEKKQDDKGRQTFDISKIKSELPAVNIKKMASVKVVLPKVDLMELKSKIDLTIQID